MISTVTQFEMLEILRTGVAGYTRRRFPALHLRLRAAKSRANLMLFRRYSVEHTYGGHRLKMLIRDAMARRWYDHDWGRLSEFDLLGENGLRDGALVFDLGAHQNLVAMLLAKEVAPSGKVIAVEGTKHNAGIGAANVELNGIANLKTIHAVVGGSEDRIAFSQMNNGEVVPGTHAKNAIQQVTIDSLARKFGHPTIILMDIEGYELQALRGANDTMQRGATWLIEVHGDDTLAKYSAHNLDVVQRFSEGHRLYFKLNEDAPFLELTDMNAVPKTRFWLAAVPGPSIAAA